MPGVLVYRCPDGSYVLGGPEFCPAPSEKAAVDVQLGATGNRTRFLGSHHHPLSEPAEEPISALTPKPEPLDIVALMMKSIGWIVLVWLILLLLKRKRRHHA